MGVIAQASDRAVGPSARQRGRAAPEVDKTFPKSVDKNLINVGRQRHFRRSVRVGYAGDDGPRR